MALYNNNTKQTKKVYSTKPEDMMADAKEYAKNDFTTVLAVHEHIAGNKLNEEAKKELAEVLISVKYNQIVEARTKRVSYFD